MARPAHHPRQQRGRHHQAEHAHHQDDEGDHDLEDGEPALIVPGHCRTTLPNGLMITESDALPELELNRTVMPE
jgi:hypothetical protein